MPVAEPAAIGDVHKRALTIVVKQAALAYAGDEEVGETVVIVISHGDAQAVHLHIQARAPGHVCEGAVAIVVVEAQGGAALFVARPVHAVDEDDVLPAVVIVIQKRAAGTQRFGQIFAAERAAVCLEIDAGRRSHFDKAQRKRGLGIRGRPACRQKKRTARKEIPAGHGIWTRPLRTAYRTNSAVRWMPSASIRLARCTETVFTLRSSNAAISLLDLPSAINWRICFSRLVSLPSLASGSSLEDSRPGAMTF